MRICPFKGLNSFWNSFYMVFQVCKSYNLPVTAVATLEEAMVQISKGPWMALVAALGTKPGVDLLFDREKESSLILAAKQLASGLPFQKFGCLTFHKGRKATTSSYMT